MSSGHYSDQEESKPSELRLLIVAPTSSYDANGKPASSPRLELYHHTNILFQHFLTHLTGVSPPQDLTSFAGYTSHEPYTIRNKYYSTKITLWCDELPCHCPTGDEKTSLTEWRNNMLSAEAQEVRAVIGGLVLLLPWTQSRLSSLRRQEEALQNYGRLLKCVNDLRDKIEDESGREIATIVVLQDVSNAELRQAGHDSALEDFATRLEDVAVTDHDIFGWEVVPWKQYTAAEDKQPQSMVTTQSDLTSIDDHQEKTGIPRIKEVLQQVHWAAPISVNSDVDLDTEVDVVAHPLNDVHTNNTRMNAQAFFSGKDELAREMAELHFAVDDQQKQETNSAADSGDDLQIGQLTALMTRAVEIKAAGAEMNKEERANYAKTEIQRLMNELDIR